MATMTPIETLVVMCLESKIIRMVTVDLGKSVDFRLKVKIGLCWVTIMNIEVPKIAT